MAKLLPALLLALDDHLPWIGRGPDHWALFPERWSAGFLLYLAMSSFLLVPIVEELTFRGYMLARLREAFDDAGALTLVAVVFALVHLQYLKAEVLSLGLTASLFVGSLAYGYAVVRTGSLLPCVVAHALQNLPLPPGEWSEEMRSSSRSPSWCLPSPAARCGGGEAISFANCGAAAPGRRPPSASASWSPASPPGWRSRADWRGSPRRFCWSGSGAKFRAGERGSAEAESMGLGLADGTVELAERHEAWARKFERERERRVRPRGG